MRNSRKKDEIRKPRVTIDFCKNSLGSVLFEMENTRIICAADISEDVPDHAKKNNTGWLTAEYSLLPYSTNPRQKRQLLKRDGRSVEIQRLIGRSLRCVVDLSMMENISITVDCDVLQADGGTRAASITGAYIALKLALSKIMKKGIIHKIPIIANVAAISAGYVDNELLLDLDYREDKRAEVDMNIVMDSTGKLVEIQGTGESSSFSFDQLNDMMDLAKKGINELIEIQNKY
ncbi:ribonuclease PH [Spirochaetota bacterium]